MISLYPQHWEQRSSNIATPTYIKITGNCSTITVRATDTGNASCNGTILIYNSNKQYVSYVSYTGYLPATVNTTGEVYIKITVSLTKVSYLKSCVLQIETDGIAEITDQAARLSLKDWEQGTILSSGDANSNTRIRTPKKIITHGHVSYVGIYARKTGGTELRNSLMMYDKQGNLLEEFDWYSNQNAIPINRDNVNFRICLSDNYNNNISPQDLSYCYITLFGNCTAEYEGSEVFVPVLQRQYITVYNYDTPQELFDTHGLGVLMPTECTISEDFNGKWVLSITHPIDDLGKWDYIRPNNIIKAQGQLFTIKTTDYTRRGSQEYVTAQAEAIFYQLSDGWIFPNAYITGAFADRLITWAWYYTDFMVHEGQTVYTFTRDVEDHIGVLNGYDRWHPLTDGMTFTEFLLGSEGILSLSGAEIYRNNFYYSIRRRMENSNDNAFEIRVGKNLKGIKRTIDTSTMCTYFAGYDNYGNAFAISWGTALDFLHLPHNIIRSANYNYTFDENIPEDRHAEMAMNRLEDDVTNYFYRYCYPIISYDVDIEDVSQNPDFIEFSDNPEYKVGNIGTLYDDRLGEKITIKITHTETDAITGKVKRVTFGNTRSLVNQGGYKATLIDIEPTVVLNEFHIRDSESNLVYDSEGNRIMQRMEV